ncbi:transcriptional regulator [Vibrio kasasachensis]|uniref:winged helix-turn-helix domain-containing protein n=1 Tax=Vibrio kasasachensis TaxID=2910248 RepID=UPI003D0D9CC9
MSNIGTKFNLADKFTFDPNTNALVDTLNDDNEIRLGSNESRILLFLLENQNSVVSRNDLYGFVWREQGFEVDDSSLTQAISTLRKLLNDPTKSPKFIKTIPKRGYQLICSVERMTPLISGDSSTALPLSSTDDEPMYLEPEINLAEDVEREIEIADAALNNQTVPSPSSKTLSLITKIALVLALGLPILTIVLGKPSTSQFQRLATFDDVIVQTPINHPSLTHWLSAIEQCVSRYKVTHQGEEAPIKVIATGGQNNQLVLNYIHQPAHSGENITVRIFSDQDNINHICQ